MGTAVVAALALGAACALWVLVQRRATACRGGDPAAGCAGQCGACGERKDEAQTTRTR